MRDGGSAAARAGDRCVAGDGARAAQARRLLVITTHPIQYVVPWYRALSGAPGLDLEVLFLREPDARQQGIGFGTAFTWDVPLRDGYRSSVLGIEPGRRGLARCAALLRRHLRRARPDAILITGWNEPALVVAFAAAISTGTPIIVRGDSNTLRARPPWARLLHKALLRSVSAAVVVGRSNRDFYVENGVAEERLFDGCHFVESDRLLAMAEAHAGDRESLRQAAGFGASEVVFCFVGKHVSTKRPMMLVEAAAALRAEGRPTSLLFAGSGELTPALRLKCAQLGVPAHFTGFLNQSELWRAYVGADALVLPSDANETWGLVVNEAMIFGLPAIVSDQVGCGPDLIEDGVTGYVFRDGTAGLAEAMRRLAEQGDRRRWMGEEARRRVCERYSMPVATAGLLKALSTVAG